MRTKQDLIADFIEENSIKSPKILDIGFAQEPNPYLKGEVYGIDLVDKKEDLYKETKTVDLNFEDIPYGDKKFNVVTMGCTLAHVANPLHLLCEINRVLIGGGLLIVSSPNPHYYWEVILNVFFHFFKKRVSTQKFEEHFYSFSRFDMRTIMSRSGFEISDERGYLFALVKTKLRFNPVKFPGMAYEIIYLARKKSEPQYYATYQTEGNAAGSLLKLPTKY